MTEHDAIGWTRLEGIEPVGTNFPANCEVDGERIWVFKTDKGFRGVQENCPHQNVKLGNAVILGGGAMIRCVLHGFTFKMANGAGVNCKGYQIKVYDVHEADGALFARPASTVRA